MDDMIENISSLKLDCVSILSIIGAFLGTLLSLRDNRNDKMVSETLKDMISKEVLFNCPCPI